MAPDQYKSLALSVAKDLLLNPSEESLKDYQHKTHLYSILTRHRDLDFAKDAQELLIDAAGKLDRFALNYLTTVLKADVVPMLAKAHDDPNIKSQWERQSLLSYIMRYVGMHPGADEFFKKIMSQPVEQTGTTSYYQSPQYKALSYLSYNADQETATKRKALLESVRPSVTDEKLKSMLDSTGRRLDYRIDPKTYNRKGNSGSGGGGAAIEGHQLFFNQGGGGLLLQDSGPDGQSSTIRILPAGGKK